MPKTVTPIQFLSTLSLRRATVGQKRLRQKLAISIHALLAESDRDRGVEPSLPAVISIHALLAESDVINNVIDGIDKIFLSTLSLRRATDVTQKVISRIEFLSTLSLRRATRSHRQTTCASCISIHALLAESDRGMRRGSPGLRNFYPRSPCGERPFMLGTLRATREFLSTLSLRRATRCPPSGCRS